MTIEAEVLSLEERRCKAIAEVDVDELRDVLADDYVHIYGSGETSGKEAYIQAITAAPRVPERSKLLVRLYGDIAIITGDLLNRITRPDGEVRIVDAVATQVAQKQDGTWRFVSCQLTARRVATAVRPPTSRGSKRLP